MFYCCLTCVSNWSKLSKLCRPTSWALFLNQYCVAAPNRACRNTGSNCIEECSAGQYGIYQWCGSCAYYISCQNGTTFYFLCTPGTSWDEVANDCLLTTSTTCYECIYRKYMTVYRNNVSTSKSVCFYSHIIDLSVCSHLPKYLVVVNMYHAGNHCHYCFKTEKIRLILLADSEIQRAANAVFLIVAQNELGIADGYIQYLFKQDFLVSCCW